MSQSNYRCELVLEGSVEDLRKAKQVLRVRNGTFSYPPVFRRHVGLMDRFCALLHIDRAPRAGETINTDLTERVATESEGKITLTFGSNLDNGIDPKALDWFLEQVPFVRAEMYVCDMTVHQLTDRLQSVLQFHQGIKIEAPALTAEEVRRGVGRTWWQEEDNRLID